ncbi:hypothetical protein ACUY2E_10245 [Corynebacterium confusum]
MREFTLFGVDGSVWPLTSWEHAGVFFRAEPVDLQADDDGRISGSLDLVVADHRPDGSRVGTIDDVMSAWRRAWSKHRDCTLRVDDDKDSLSLRLRLESVVPNLPSLDAEGYEEFSQSVVAPEGAAWLRKSSRLGPSVRVVNAGDHEAWVSIRWQRGGSVRLPSGATFILPTVPEPRTILLDPGESCAVVDVDGVLDRSLWVELRSRVFPEPVPPGQVREFVVPEGASVLFNERVDDPWA